MSEQNVPSVSDERIAELERRYERDMADLQGASSPHSELVETIREAINRTYDDPQLGSSYSNRALEALTGLEEQFDTLLRAAVNVRDSWLLYENDVDDAHLTSACSDLDQLIGGSPEWVRLVEGLTSNPASEPKEEANA